MYFVYIIKSEKNNRLYRGMTNNINRRLKQHNKGLCSSTKSYRPWKLMYTKSFENRINARKYEKRLKSGFLREIQYKNCAEMAKLVDALP